MKNNDHLLTKTAAAEQLGISPHRIGVLMKDGRLTPVKTIRRNTPMVMKAEVEKLKEQEARIQEGAE